METRRGNGGAGTPSLRLGISGRQTGTPLNHQPAMEMLGFHGGTLTKKSSIMEQVHHNTTQVRQERLNLIKILDIAPCWSRDQAAIWNRKRIQSAPRPRMAATDVCKVREQLATRFWPRLPLASLNMLVCRLNISLATSLGPDQPNAPLRRLSLQSPDSSTRQTSPCAMCTCCAPTVNVCNVCYSSLPTTVVHVL